MQRAFQPHGREFRAVFALARKLGVKTCIGTETPLTIPAAVREHLKQLGKDPDDPAVVRELYDGMFQRIAAALSGRLLLALDARGLDLGRQQADSSSRRRPATSAPPTTPCAAAGKPFTLATCGWVLGPQHDRAALDALLPKECPMSCINRRVGHDPVEPAFANIHGRPKWAIPWMENDPNLVAYQPWAGRMRHDAVDAKRLGCDGLLGIHWRTKALAANVSALAGAPGTSRGSPPATTSRRSNRSRTSPWAATCALHRPRGGGGRPSRLPACPLRHAGLQFGDSQWRLYRHAQVQRAALLGGRQAGLQC